MPTGLEERKVKKYHLWQCLQFSPLPLGPVRSISWLDLRIYSNVFKVSWICKNGTYKLINQTRPKSLVPLHTIITEAHTLLLLHVRSNPKLYLLCISASSCCFLVISHSFYKDPIHDLYIMLEQVCHTQIPKPR